MSKPLVRMTTIPHDCWKGGHSPDPEAPVPPPTAKDAVVVRRKAGRAAVRVSLAQTAARMGDLAGEGFGLTLADLAGGEPGE